MDKKPFDHIENKIKEAADNSSQYPFEEQSWDRMETLLDKGKKRRVFAWWWFALPLLIIAGAGIYMFNSHSSKANIPTVNTVNNVQSTIQQPNTNSTTIVGADMNTTFNKNIASPIIINNMRLIKTNARIKSHIKTNSQIDDVVTDQTINSSTNDKIVNDVKPVSINKPNDSVNKQSFVIQEKKIIPKKDSTLAITKTNDKKKGSSTHGFYALAMAGPDAADVNFLSFNNSTITPRYGVGIGYQLSNRLSVQTGFYAGHKKYIAGPGDYKAKAGTYYSTVDITKVNADCMVYDIPVTIRYDFIQHPNTDYYATAGISSFIMKSEAYQYNYIDAGTAYTGSKTYTGNQSLFSILNLSIGMEKKLNNKFSLLAEPSVSIPLVGVGDGSVKLYSTSLLVGIKYRFSKK